MEIVNRNSLTVNREETRTNTTEEYFGFEKLRVYQSGLQLVDVIFDICAKLSLDLQYSVSDQLRRAVLSITNNIAEGSDKPSPRERKRYYHTALSSARECASMCIVLHRRSALDTLQYAKLRTQIRDVTNMLVGLMDSLS